MAEESDFRYSGTDEKKKSFVESVNWCVNALKTIKVDLGALRGGTQLVTVASDKGGITLDFTKVELGGSGGGTPPVTGMSEYMVLQLIDVDGVLTPTWDWVRLADYTP
ncbi:unnamed protein product [marine sediment metagenome]|uniref:Uncharacterized protein n=1 Tax=marine sediment metagenome TaxID=412755 RepID=X0S181_9ZZZZ